MILVNLYFAGVDIPKNESGMPYERHLALEIVDAYNETGAAIKNKEDHH